MKIGGSLTLDGKKYFVVLNQLKDKTTWTVFSDYTSEDRVAITFGGKPKNPPANLQIGIGLSRGHVVEHIVRYRKDSRVAHLPGSNNQIITKILDTISTMRNTGYRVGESQVEEKIEGIDLVKHVKARTKTFITDYKLTNRKYSQLNYKDSNMLLTMSQSPVVKNITCAPKDAELVDANRTLSERVYVENVSSITFDELCRSHDTDWLIDPVTGEWKKDYKMIEDIASFEQFVMTPILHKLRWCIDNNVKFLLAMDTETTGLNLYDLPEGSPIKDHLVTMQLSWEEDQAVLINFDMEKFGNVPVKYAMERLFPLVREYLPEELNTWQTISTIDGEEIEFRRSDILVIGHNTIFDCRVTFSVGYPWFFNEDTMQLRFNLDPVGSKGNKGLKHMSKQFQGVDQWELSDTLGKGNEDKFRYIQDKSVALAYGGADSDMTLSNFKILRRITPDSMYRAYKKSNMYTWYILAEAEYRGIKLNEEGLKHRTEIVGKNLKAIEDFVFYAVGNSMARQVLFKKLELRDKAGLLNMPIQQAFEEAWSQVDKSGDKLKYKFNLSGNDLRDVLYSKLGYPKMVYTESGEVAVNKEAIQRLLKQENKGKGTLKEHLYTVEYDKNNPNHHDNDGEPKKEYILINKNEYNKYKFPLAYVLSKYKELEKEYTGYYLPFSKGDWSGRIYKNFSTTNIETQRISNPIQTTKKDLKKMIIATGPDWYPVNWDKAQIEARVFVAEAGDYRMVHKLNNPENDYHTENASLMFNVPAYLVSKDLRKASKTINFGLPYGLGPEKMCERIHDGVVNEKNLLDTLIKIDAYRRANILTWNLLESYRDSALQEWHCSDEFKTLLGYEGRKLGHVVNATGFHRLFDLTDVTEKWQREKIRRAAGNFPIQSYAKDIFTGSIIRLYIELERMGLRDKFQIHMLVHDEIQCSAHKSIDPVVLMDIFRRCCMPSYPVVPPTGKTDFIPSEQDKYMNYFTGINFGDSWYECKQDANECPVGYVFWMTNKLRSGEYTPQEWTDRPRDIIEPTMHTYFVERLHQVYKHIQNDIDENPIDFKRIITKITNYTVRANTADFFEPIVKLDKGASTDTKYLASLAQWALEYYGETKEVIYKDTTISLLDLMNNNFLQDVVEDSPSVLVDSLFDKDDNDEFLDYEQADNYSFDENEEIAEFFNMRDFIISEDEEETPAAVFIAEREARILEVKRKEKLRNLNNMQVVGNTVNVRCTEFNYKDVLNRFKLSEVDSDDSYKVNLMINRRMKRRLRVDKSVDLIAIDETLFNLGTFSALKKDTNI